MTLTLTRDDFAHMTRRRQLQDGRWQTVCACGWLSRPEAHPDLLGWNCPQKAISASQGHDLGRGEAQPTPVPSNWYPGTLGTHYAGQPLDVTPESIADAKAARDRERRELERQTGVTILEDGTIVWPPTPPTSTSVH